MWLPDPKMSEDIRICFIGDSLVAGVGDETALGWVGRVCAAARVRGVPVTHYNLGVRRETSRDILRRWQVECRLRLPRTCDCRIVLSCGVNDTMQEGGAERVPPDESRRNVRDILRAAGNWAALMVGPPPVDDAAHNSRIDALSTVFSEEAAELGVAYIDLYTRLAADARYSRALSKGDGAHPGGAGYAMIADIISGAPNWWFHTPR